MGPREVLNKLKWHPDFSLDRSEIVILHRGAPGDQIILEGKDIQDLGSGFMLVVRSDKTVRIPYHRVLKVISSSGEVIWESS